MQNLIDNSSDAAAQCGAFGEVNRQHVCLHFGAVLSSTASCISPAIVELHAEAASSLFELLGYPVSLAHALSKEE